MSVTRVSKRPATMALEGFVFQALAPVPVFDGNHAVIGSWVVDGESCGMGIRESDGPITDNLSRFVPHLFR
jgi:glutathionylspermidine synthase